MPGSSARSEKARALSSYAKAARAFAVAPAALFFALFYIWPLLEIGRVSFTPGALSQGQTPITALADPAVLRVVGFTAWQATLSTALTLLFGLPLAWVFARFRFFGQSIWRALATVPFVMPTVVVAAALTALFGPRGILPLPIFGTLEIILVAHVFYNVSVVLRIVGAFLLNRDPQLDEAAALDGADAWRIFRAITLPLALPSILTAAATVFLFTFSSFGVVLLLGGVRFTTIEVEIYQQTAQFLRLDVSTSLALLQLGVTLGLGVLIDHGQRSVEIESSGLDPRQPPHRLSHWLTVGAALTFIALALATPLIMLVLRSFGPDGDLFVYYDALSTRARGSVLAVPALTAIRNSIGFALTTMALSALLGLPLAFALTPHTRWTRLGEALLLLPLGTSAVTLGLGYFVAFDAPVDLRGTPWLLPIAHTMLALPFFVRTLLPALRAIEPQLREAAQVDGASSIAVLRAIDLPLIAPTLAAAAVFAFSISLGEFGASLLISRPDYPTITVAIFRYLGQPGALNYGMAMAMSAILMLVTALGAILTERVGAGR
jgi:thiamine transport system permease protein